MQLWIGCSGCSIRKASGSRIDLPDARRFDRHSTCGLAKINAAFYWLRSIHGNRWENAMAAKSKQELLLLALKEFEKLYRLLDILPAGLRLELDDEGVSPKDIVAHRAHWIDLFLGWYLDGQEEKTVYFPAEGYKWNETKRYNADLRARQKGMTWTEAGALLERNHNKLLRLIESLSDDQLYSAPMKGANNAWPTGRWAEAAGPSHFRSATKYFRQRIRRFNSKPQ